MKYFLPPTITKGFLEFGISSYGTTLFILALDICVCGKTFYYISIKKTNPSRMSSNYSQTFFYHKTFDCLLCISTVLMVTYFFLKLDSSIVFIIWPWSPSEINPYLIKELSPSTRLEFLKLGFLIIYLNLLIFLKSKLLTRLFFYFMILFFLNSSFF